MPSLPTPTPAAPRAESAAEQNTVFDWATVFVPLWAFGAIALLFRTAIQLVVASRWAREGRPTGLAPIEGVPGRTRIVWSSATDVPMTLGFFRPSILLPESSGTWSEARLRAVLLHEGAHVERGDWAWLVVARVVGALYWPNPLVAFAARRLRAQAERAADDAVLHAGVPATLYATTLVELAEGLRARRNLALPFVEAGSLKSRVAAVLKDARRRPLGRIAAVAALAVGAATVGPFAALRLAFATQSVSARDGTIDLGDGHGIQVVAITSLDDGRARSWDARGAPLVQPYGVAKWTLDMFRQSGPAVPPGSVARYVFLRGLFGDDQDFPSFTEIPGGHSLPSRDVDQPGEDGFQREDPAGAVYRVVRLIVPKDVNEGRMFARIARGAWQPYASANLRNGVPTTPTPKNLGLKISSLGPQSTEIAFHLPEGFRGRQSKLITTPPSATYLTDGEAGDSTSSMDIPVRSIRRIDLLSRPSDLVVFDGLPMAPHPGATHRFEPFRPKDSIEARNGVVRLADGSSLALEGVWDIHRSASNGWNGLGQLVARRNPDDWMDRNAPASPRGLRTVKMIFLRKSAKENGQIYPYDGEGLLTPLRTPSQRFDREGDHFDVVALCGEDRRTLDLLFRLAPGDYRIVADGALGKTPGYRGFFRKGMGGKQTFSVEFPRDLIRRAEGVDSSFVPVDAAGKTVRKADESLSSSRTTSDGGENVIEFDLPPERARLVRRLEFKTRPWVWVRFPRVALYPKD